MEITYCQKRSSNWQGAVDKLVYNNYIDEQVPKSTAVDAFASYLQSIDLDLTKEYLLIQKL